MLELSWLMFNVIRTKKEKKRFHMMLFASWDVKYKFISHMLQPTDIVFLLLTNNQVVMFGDWGWGEGRSMHLDGGESS
jgi:hypothetical protein